MRCRACGAVVGTNARFCEQCGTRLQPADGVESPASTTIEAPPPTARKVGRSFARTEAMAAPTDIDGPGAGGTRADPSASGASGDRRIVTALFA